MKFIEKLKKFWRSLGPGLITGASDDEPSSIVVYSLAGAKFGLAALWTALATLPFMVILQRMAGRIGLVSGRGLAGNMKKHYPAWMLVAITVLIASINTINIGADISGMAAVVSLFFPVHSLFIAAAISVLIIAVTVVFPYRLLIRYLKWLAAVLFSYVAAAFLIQLDWKDIFYRAVVPQIIWSREYLAMIIALFGTTISPYLFFWQALEEAEEEKFPENGPHPHGRRRTPTVIRNEIGSMYRDVYAGMIFSNLITFFIIILGAFTFFKSGVTNISSMNEIAGLLKPLAGPYANILFITGIIASGTLAIPVLAGSAAYALAELFGWNKGFNDGFHKAKQFHLIIAAATVIGLLITFLGLHPVKILFYTAVIFGLASPFFILLVIHMANNPKVMGAYTSRRHSNIIAYALFALMSAGAILTIIL